MANIKNDITLEILFKTSPDMLALLDKDGKIIDCNEHCSKNLGYEKNEMIGLIGPVDMVAEYDRQKAVNAFGLVVKNGIHHNVPFDMMRKDHSIFPTIWSGAVLYDQSGNLEGYLVTGKDLSNLKNLENELAVSHETLKISRFITLGELTARLTHDIKTPFLVFLIELILLK